MSRGIVPCSAAWCYAGGRLCGSSRRPPACPNPCLAGTNPGPTASTHPPTLPPGAADDLRINLWHLDRPDLAYNVVDIKPPNMEDLTEASGELAAESRGDAGAAAAQRGVGAALHGAA